MKIAGEKPVQEERPEPKRAEEEAVPATSRFAEMEAEFHRESWPEMEAVPEIANFAVGTVVPMPTLPFS
jgi:hypothetical protein